jgi:hypothetical protein
VPEGSEQQRSAHIGWSDSVRYSDDGVAVAEVIEQQQQPQPLQQQPQLQQHMVSKPVQYQESPPLPWDGHANTLPVPEPAHNAAAAEHVAEHTAEYAAEYAAEDAAAAAVGVLTTQQQDLLDYIDDLHEMSALGLLTEAELQERQASALDSLEGISGGDHSPDGYLESSLEVVQADAGTSAEAAAAAIAPEAAEGAGSPAGAEVSVTECPVQIRVAAPRGAKLKTMRITSSLYLPSHETCAELCKAIKRGSESMTEAHTQRFVADLWHTTDAKHAVVSRAFKAFESNGRVQLDDVRGVLKCAIFYTEMWDRLAEVACDGTSPADDDAAMNCVEVVAAGERLAEPLAGTELTAAFHELMQQSYARPTDAIVAGKTQSMPLVPAHSEPRREERKLRRAARKPRPAGWAAMSADEKRAWVARQAESLELDPEHMGRAEVRGSARMRPPCGRPRKQSLSDVFQSTAP